MCFARLAMKIFYSVTSPPVVVVVVDRFNSHFPLQDGRSARSAKRTDIDDSGTSSAESQPNDVFRLLATMTLPNL